MSLCFDNVFNSLPNSSVVKFFFGLTSDANTQLSVSGNKSNTEPSSHLTLYWYPISNGTLTILTTVPFVPIRTALYGSSI